MARRISGKNKPVGAARGAPPTKGDFKPSREDILKFIAENPDRTGKRDIAKSGRTIIGFPACRHSVVVLLPPWVTDQVDERQNRGLGQELLPPHVVGQGELVVLRPLGDDEAVRRVPEDLDQPAASGRRLPSPGSRARDRRASPRRRRAAPGARTSPRPSRTQESRRCHDGPSGRLARVVDLLGVHVEVELVGTRG